MEPLRLRPNPIQSRPDLRATAIIGQMRPAMNQSLGADKEIRQHRIMLSFGGTILSESHPSPPGRFSIQRNLAEDSKLLVNVLPRASAAGQFRIRHGGNSQFIPLAGALQGFGACLVVFVVPIKPGHDHRRVHQDHGRVLRSNSSPDQCPCQVPAYFRMCACALLTPPSRRRARISPPSNSQAIRLPGNKPAAWRIGAGMLVVPLLVKTVSLTFIVRIIPAIFLPVHHFSLIRFAPSVSGTRYSPLPVSDRLSPKGLRGLHGTLACMDYCASL